LLVFSVLTAGFATAATITIRADSWAPYNEEPKSAQPGYMIDVAKLIFERFTTRSLCSLESQRAQRMLRVLDPLCALCISVAKRFLAGFVLSLVVALSFAVGMFS
jgi:hypothetical protein